MTGRIAAAIAGLAVTVALIGVGLLLAVAMLDVGAALDTPASTTTTTQCMEDMDCWRCETMGNRVCGPLKDEARSGARP